MHRCPAGIVCDSRCQEVNNSFLALDRVPLEENAYCLRGQFQKRTDYPGKTDRMQCFFPPTVTPFLASATIILVGLLILVKWVLLGNLESDQLTGKLQVQNILTIHAVDVKKWWVILQNPYLWICGNRMITYENLYCMKAIHCINPNIYGDLLDDNYSYQLDFYYMVNRRSRKP